MIGKKNWKKKAKKLLNDVAIEIDCQGDFSKISSNSCSVHEIGSKNIFSVWIQLKWLEKKIEKKSKKIVKWCSK